MNRRGFLKSIGIGAAATVLTAVVSREHSAHGTGDPCADCFRDYIRRNNGLPTSPIDSRLPELIEDEYTGYSGFSAEANAQAWDEMISKCASELAYRAGQNVQELTLGA